MDLLDVKMKLHKNLDVCFKNCKTEPNFYRNQFGDYCLLSFPNQVMDKYKVYKEIPFWDFIISKVFK